MDKDQKTRNEGGEAAGQDHVEELLVECLERTEREGPAVLEELCRKHPAHAEELRRQIGILESLSLYGGSRPPAAGDPPLERLGEFRLLRKLGEGGMGVVYLAEQTSLRRLVALKVLRSGIGSSPGLAARFQREALAVARLRHPNIVSLHAAGEEDGVPWLAMELVPGRGLDELIAEAGRGGSYLAVRDVVHWGRDLALALESAHTAGIVHRDLKPSNVRITPEGGAMLLDFGLARDLAIPGLTRTGEFQGSPHYASPEQIAGSSMDVGPWSDVHALGVTLHEAVTGRLPFSGASTEQLFQRILVQSPIPVRRLNPAAPRDLETVILRAMEKEPRRRYASAAALAADLDAIAGLRPIAARRTGVLGRSARLFRRHPVAAAALATAALAVLALALVLVRQARGDRERARGEALAAIDGARKSLEQFRTRRAQLGGAANRVATLRKSMEYNYLDPKEDEQLDREEAAVERGRREREIVLVQVLALLQRAEALDPGNSEARRLRTELYAEKFSEATNALDGGLASFYRDLVLAIDQDGAAARQVTGRVEVAFASEPPGAELHLFRYRSLAEMSEGGEPRLAPVPLAGAVPGVPPGAWCLRVVRGAGLLRPGDLVLEIAGQPVRGTMFEWTREAGVSPPEVLHGEDGTPVMSAYDAQVRGLRARTPEAIAESGGVEAKLFAKGTIIKATLPAGLRVRVTAAPLPVSEATRTGLTPSAPIPLEPGSYLVLLRHAGCEDLRWPFKVEPGPSIRHDLALLPEGTTPEGFVYVPLISGGFAKDAFWLQEREVNAGEYLAFLDDPATGRAMAGSLARILVPREGSEPLWDPRPDGGFALPASWNPDIPVFGVSHDDAEAYARWRSERAAAAGEPFHFGLPTFDEWKTSGHGADGRDYVFGWVFRPKWMKSNYARQRTQPEPGLRFPIDESVFGAFDQSGSMLEWLDDWYRENGLRRAAGGGWGQADPRSYFLVEGGLGMPPQSSANMIGFRLVARRRPRFRPGSARGRGALPSRTRSLSGGR